MEAMLLKVPEVAARLGLSRAKVYDCCNDPGVVKIASDLRFCNNGGFRRKP